MRGEKPLKPSVRSQEERNALALENKGLVGAFVGKFYKRYPFFLKYYPYEDACSDAWLGLLRACDLWREDLNVKLSTYAYIWMKRHLREGSIRFRCFLYLSGDLRRKFTHPPVEVKKQCELEVGAWKGMLDSILYKSPVTTGEIDHMAQEILSKIPSQYLEIVKLHISGVRLKTIGEKFGWSKDNTRRKLRAIYRRLAWRFQDMCKRAS